MKAGLKKFVGFLIEFFIRLKNMRRIGLSIKPTKKAAILPRDTLLGWA
jgi:hypothetical protein